MNIEPYKRTWIVLSILSTIGGTFWRRNEGQDDLGNERTGARSNGEQRVRIAWNLLARDVVRTTSLCQIL